MPVWEIFTYGNGEFLAMVFNGVVALMGDGDFVTLMRLAGIVGLIWVSLKAGLFRTQVEWTWLIWFVLIYGVLFIPKVDVVIVDRLDNNQTRVVANVPWGLGVFAGAASKIGDWFTRSSETVMSLPDDLKYHRNGMVFGSSLVQAASQFEITDGRIKGNMSEFMRQCVFYDVLFRRYTWTELLEADDTWQFIKENTAENARAFAYVHANGTQQIYACKTGAETVLETDWAAEITRAASLYGVRFNKHLSMADASAKLMADLPTSYDYLAGISRSGGDIIRANMMANSFRRAFGNAASATDANAAAQDFALAQAEQQQRSTYAVMGQLAAKFLPLLKNIYEGILFGMFPFLFLVFMLPIGVKIFLSYLKNIIWLQLWAPLYAVLNLLMTLHAGKASAAAAAQLGGQALSLATHSGLAAVNADVAILAGYMGMSIPLIAYGLVSGGQMALTQFASQVGAVAQSAAQQAGAAASTGNINLANLGAYNTGMFKYDTNAAVNYGQGQYSDAYGATHTLTRSGAHGQSNLQTSVGVEASLGQALQFSKSNSLAELDQATLAAQRQFTRSLAASGSEALDFSRSTGFGVTKTDGWSTSDATNYKKMSEHMTQLSSKLSEGEKFTQKQSDEIVLTAYAEASAGGGFDVGVFQAGLKTGLKTAGSHKSVDEIDKTVSSVAESVDADVIKSGVDSLRNYAASSSIDNSSHGSADLSARLGAQLQDMTKHDRAVQEARSRQTAAEERWSVVGSDSQTITANVIPELVDDLRNSGHSQALGLLSDPARSRELAQVMDHLAREKFGGGFDGHDAANRAIEAVTNPTYGQAGFAQGTRHDAAVQVASADATVDHAAAENGRKVAGRDAVRADHRQNLEEPTERNLRPGDPFAGSNAQGVFAENLGTYHNDLAQQEARALKENVNQETDPTSGEGRRAIESEEAGLQGDIGIKTGHVTDAIEQGRAHTEGMTPLNTARKEPK